MLIVIPSLPRPNGDRPYRSTWFYPNSVQVCCRSESFWGQCPVADEPGPNALQLELTCYMVKRIKPSPRRPGGAETAMALEKELQYFDRELKHLLEKHRGEFVLIRG